MGQNTDWKKKLYARASREYDAFVEDLKEMTFDDMAGRAFELAVKQDILEMLREGFPSNTLKGLADMENPLEMIYQAGMENVATYLDYVRKSMEQCSEEILAAQAEEFYKNPDAPLYRKNLIEAKQSGEIQLWRANKKRNEECLAHFNKNIEERHESREFRTFLKTWTGEFGFERCKTLLAAVIKKATHDGRYYKAVKDSAASVKMPNITYEDFYSNVHPVIINFAYEGLMEMERSKDISMGNKGGKSAKKESRKRTEPER